jgi:drug/metabolite transporter (DMT)-like permease
MQRVLEQWVVEGFVNKVKGIIGMKKHARLFALAEAFLLALVLGSTLVISRLALNFLGPFTLTAFRYLFAFLVLLPFIPHGNLLRRWSPRTWLLLLLIGISFYVLGNGALILALRFLPATTDALLLNLVPLLVLAAGVTWLKELPTRLQLVGVVIGLLGGFLFFLPGLSAGEPLGLAIVTVGLLGNAAYGLLGRALAREGRVDTLSMTAIPLALGGLLLFPFALLIEGIPTFVPQAWALVVVLAVMNTAVAYVLYNHALKVLAAFEVSVILSINPLITALWGWLLLGERLQGLQILGMAVVISGVALVQASRRHEA